MIGMPSNLFFTVNSQFFVSCAHAENNRFCLDLAVGTFKDKTVIIFSYADKGLSDKFAPNDFACE